jgi:hypothetical protein
VIRYETDALPADNVQGIAQQYIDAEFDFRRLSLCAFHWRQKRGADKKRRSEAA